MGGGEFACHSELVLSLPLTAGASHPQDDVDAIPKRVHAVSDLGSILEIFVGVVDAGSSSQEGWKARCRCKRCRHADGLHQA